ncbi:MAG: amidohydrolase family protein, partial [Halioglobus sp.]|nr:amidohydrolase family protein [Halioglobus sp.]
MIKPFLTLSIATALAIALSGCSDKAEPPAEHSAAEQVFINGAIYTADPAQRSVSAMAVSGDRIRFVGNDEAAATWIGADTTVTDLQGKRVLPGLHDAHVHPAGVIEVEDCNLDNEPVDLAQLAEFAAACVERLAIPDGDWLLVKQWNFAQNNRPAGDLKTLRQALDRASVKHPILLGG